MSGGRDPVVVPAAVQHLLLAGPVLGFLAVVWQYQAFLGAPDHPDPATGHVIRCLRAFHGRALGPYYITSSQALVEECLAIPAACWMILVIGGLVAVGVRLDLRRRRLRNHPTHDTTRP